MTTYTDAIQRGIALQQAGDLVQAERIYRQVLQANPQHAGAMHLLGLVAFQQGRYSAAVEVISRAILLDGSQPAFHANLGEAFRALGRLDEARRSYEQALRLNPDLAEAHNNLGTILQKQGRRDEARAAYQRAIAARPNYADAHNNLGTTLQESLEWDQAAACYRRAVGLDPRYAKGFYNLGVVLGVQGRLAEARSAFEQTVALVPENAEAHYGLAMILQRQGDLSAAEAAYRETLRLRPTLAEAISSLGTLYQTQGKLPEAVRMYAEAAALDPRYAEAHYNWGTALRALDRLDEAAEKYQQAIRLKPDLAEAHFNLGTILQAQGQFSQAAAAYQETIRLNPGFALAHNNLGNVFKLQDRCDEAIACYEQAIAARPDRPEAYNNLGSVLQQQGRLEETLDCYHRAISAQSDCAEAHNNLGTALTELGRRSEALTAYEASLRLNPELPETHYNLSLLLLSQGNFVRGWQEFAWRLRTKSYPRRDWKRPPWSGEPLEGRTLLVHAEQGLGDTLQFLRYLELCRERGGRVLFVVQPGLLPLLKTSGLADIVSADEQLPEFDCHVPLLNLPGIFQTNFDNLPARVPYLTAAADLVDQWRQTLADHAEFKVGITWQGNPSYTHDRLRSIPLARLAKLRQAGVRLFSLQKHAGIEQLAALGNGAEIVDLGPRLDQGRGAFMDTAAVMRNLDLVITSDTATAHLAGALGVPVWVVLSTMPDWRWFLDRDDSPWYPSMRLFRQHAPRDWAHPIEAMSRELAALVVRRAT